MKKFKLTKETINFRGHKLHRIRALRDFSGVKKGDLGGFIESEANLAHEGNCWVYGDARVYGNARVLYDARVGSKATVYGDVVVCGRAQVYGNAEVGDNAWVGENARVSDNAWVYGNASVGHNAHIFGDAWVSGEARVGGDAQVERTSDYVVFKNWWSSGRHFTWTRSNNAWSVGCFYGTSEQLIAKAYKDSEESGREYERVVKYVESILADARTERQ